MKLHEYQAREVLSRYGVPMPPGHVAASPAEAEAIAHDWGVPVVVKAQVLAGGRGKAGGVKRAGSPRRAASAARTILGSTVQGHRVQKVLVVQALSLVREFYLGAVFDRAAKTVTFMASGMGGVDIEEVARSTPDAIVRVTTDPLLGLADYQARDLARGVGLSGEQAKVFASVAKTLYRVFLECDCSLLEVNPFGLTEDGTLTALDAKMVIDDNALGRQPVLAALRDASEEGPEEAEARHIGVNYVMLDGNVACMVNGAGLAMATMDAIKHQGGEPANFLDLGGGAKPDQIGAALDIILRDENVRAVLVNMVAGIIRCDIVARALRERLDAGAVKVPVVARLVGNYASEGREILADTDVVLAETMEEAALLVVQQAEAQAEARTEDRGEVPR